MSFPPTLDDLRKAQQLLKERRGVGDVVAAVTTAIGIPPCGGCDQRREWLNQVLPLQRTDSEQ